jgi:hypothetical protein
MGNGLSSRMTDPKGYTRLKTLTATIVKESDLSNIIKDSDKNLPFEISMTADIDVNKFKEFLKHECSYNQPPIREILCSGMRGSIVVDNKGRFTYMYTPTIQGTILQVKCKCGKTSDITKYIF